MKSIEVKGKTIEQALKLGLIELEAVSLDDVEVKILKHPGIFTKAVVQMTLVGEVADKLDTTSPQALMNKIEKRAASVQHTIQPKRPVPPNAKNDRNAVHPSPPVPQNVKNDRNAVHPSPRQPERELPKQTVQTPMPQPQEPKKVQRQERPQATESQPKEKPFERERLPKPTAEEIASGKIAAEKYLKTALELMGIAAELEVTSAGEDININIITDSTQIIGYRGETLDSLEYLTMHAVGSDNRIKVNLDSGGYREKRTTSLVELAKRLAEKAVRTGRRVDLEPMSSLNRKIIHSALAENDAVITRSDGHEPNRYLVIIPKKGNGAPVSPNGGMSNNRNRNNNNRNRKGGKGGGYPNANKPTNPGGGAAE